MGDNLLKLNGSKTEVMVNLLYINYNVKLFERPFTRCNYVIISRSSLLLYYILLFIYIFILLLFLVHCKVLKTFMM